MSAILDMWEMARQIRPLPYDMTGRELRQSFSREGAFVQIGQPTHLPRKHPVPPGVVILLPAA